MKFAHHNTSSSAAWIGTAPPLQQRQRRYITTRAARALLGFPSKSSTDEKPITLKELRHAYFAAAKKCHPDMQQQQQQQPPDRNDDDDDEETNDDNNDNSDESKDEFLQLTRAYELLQAEITKDGNLILSTISASEEEEFRLACQSELGVAAEIVEECKRTPIFRQWLMGGSDSAHRWKIFFLSHGGLAPKLRPNGGAISAGGTIDENGKYKAPPHTTRRKRR